jgi:hypothetical protein
MTDEELKELVASLAVKSDRLDAAQRKTDEQMRKTDEQMRKTDDQIAGVFAAQRETERIIKELQSQTAKEIEKVSKNIGKLGNRLGEFVEEAVRPAAERLFKDRGIEVKSTHRNVSAKGENEGLQVDLLAVSQKELIVIECKSHLGVDDVNEHLERLEKVKRLLSEYQDKDVIGAVAGMVIPDNVESYAIRKGLYVIGQTGEHMEVRNAQGFQPKVW